MVAILDLLLVGMVVGGLESAQRLMADSNSVTTGGKWQPSLKADSGVWFELYNEPHDITSERWLNGGPACGFTTVGIWWDGLDGPIIVVATGNAYGSHLGGLPVVDGTNVAYATSLRQRYLWRRH